MAASWKMRIWGELNGLDGQDFSMPSNETDAETPVDGAKNAMSTTTTAAAIDIANVTSAQLRGIEIVCKSGQVYIDPVSSANITAACFLSADNGMFQMYQVGVTSHPWVQALSSTARIAYMYYGVAT
jgi:hypothetical protein